VAGQYPVLLTAENSNGQPTGYTWQNGNTLPDAGTAVELGLPNGFSTAVNTLSVTASGLPGYDVDMQEQIGLTMIASGVGVPGSTSFENVLAPDSGASQQFTYPAGFPDAVQTETSVFTTAIGNCADVSAVATRASPVADAGLAVDFAQLLPMLVSSSVDIANAAQPLVTWSPADAGALTATDGIVVMVVWRNGSNNGVWTIVAPPTATQVQAPVLPASASAWSPALSAGINTPPTVAFVQASFFAGYGDLRQNAGPASLTSLLLRNIVYGEGGYSSGPIVPPMQLDGTLQMSVVTPSAD
jgi:hypothetical protein